MMTSLAQSYSPHPGGMQPHPGMAQGHMVPHNPGQPGQPGPGMPQQMHMGVSGPGPQVSQGGAMMGMPPGAPSQHALQHLNPQAQQAHIFQQQQMAFANPMQQIQQQQILQHQRQQQVAVRQQMLAQQYSGMPVQMANGMNQMTPAQFQAMRGGPMARPVNLPQHLQQQQQQAEHSLQQQQQQQQAQAQHQQLMMAQQQMAMQQQAANAQNQAGNNPPGQANQMNPQQSQNMQAAQTAAMMQHHQQQQQQQHAHALSQAAQQAAQGQGQPQPQPGQPNAQAQAQAQQPQPVPQQQQSLQQQQALALLQQQQRQGNKFKGQCVLKLMLFGDCLSGFAARSKPLSSFTSNGTPRLAAQALKQQDDLNYWNDFVVQFFSPKGVFRHSLWILDETSNKQYEITYPALPRYFQTHFESGVKNMQMTVEKGSEKELPNNGHYIESNNSSFVYWFDTGSQLIATGTLKAHFDAEQKIELLEFVTTSHEEYLPRTQVVNAARPLHEWSKEWRSLNAPPDGKQSPEMNKKKAKAMKSPPQPPPEIDIPESLVSKMGITPSVFRFLEFAEVIGQMNPLFSYSHQNSSLSPNAALDSYISMIALNGTENPGQQPNPTGPRTPGMGNFPMGVSPAQAHLQLPDGSPRVTGSPAQAPNMQLQQSQHGTSSSGPSANTSPNASNKRRRPSVKDEVDVQVNGNPSKTAVKPSPRIGGKRQKGNPA